MYSVSPKFSKRNTDGSIFYTFEVNGKFEFWFTQNGYGEIFNIKSNILEKTLTWIQLCITADIEYNCRFEIHSDSCAIQGTSSEIQKKVKQLHEIGEICNCIADFFKNQFPKIRIKPVIKNQS